MSKVCLFYHKINSYSDGKSTLEELKTFLDKNQIKYEDDGNVLKFEYLGQDYTVTHNTQKKEEERKAREEQIRDCQLPLDNPSNELAFSGVGVYLGSGSAIASGKSIQQQADEMVEGERGNVERKVKEVLGEVDPQVVNDIMNKLQACANDYVSKGYITLDSLKWDLLNIIWDEIDKLKAEQEAKRQEEIDNAVLPVVFNNNDSNTTTNWIGVRARNFNL